MKTITDREHAALRAVAEAAYVVAWEVERDAHGRHLKYCDEKHAHLRQKLNELHQASGVTEQSGEDKP